MELLEKVKGTIRKHSMLSKGNKVLIALSGGPDSVCLLVLLNKLKDEFNLNLHALYIDHGLRPDETPKELKFCKNLCDRLDVRLITKSIDVMSYAKEQLLNKQEAARKLRYKTFDEVSSEIKADRIALGHTANDQAETLIMRLFRGSGPKGLSGIPPVRGNVIRPLIEVKREDVEQFLDLEGLSFIVDSSNLREDYIRNKVRLSLIPMLKEFNSNIIESLAKTSDILREEERYFEILVTKALMKLISRKTDSRIELFLAPLEAMERVILRRVLRMAIEETKGLRAISFIHIEDILKLINSGKPGDRLYLPGGIRAIKEYSTLVLTSETPVKIRTYNFEVPGEVAIREAGIFIKAVIEESIEGIGDGRAAVVFDADTLTFPFTVRARKPGDFFYPFGFGRRKKLQDFFVDEKVPRDERDRIPLIVSGDDIIWVAGYRMDDRFRVTDKTKKFLKILVKKIVV